MDQSCDFLIIGAGIVGLTVAYELNQRLPAAKIIIIDKEAQAGKHASGRNSGVLHSGIYYSSDTLKAKVCADGARRMIAFAEEHGIAYKKNGKVIVTRSENDQATVEKLLKNAAENGIRSWAIDNQQLRELEPYVAEDTFGIYSPDTAVIDNSIVVQTLTKLLQDKGVEFHWNQAFIKTISPGTINTTNNRFSFGHLFNCAGAYADKVAKAFDTAHEYALVPFKGIYWKLHDNAKHLVNANIYPVPDINLPFLGVHLTRNIHGDVYVGPTAIPAFGRENYGLVSGIAFKESVEIMTQLARMYAGNNNNFRQLSHAELSKYLKSNFLSAAQKLVPCLKSEDMIPTPKAGIRPQLINISTKKLEMDYILLEKQHSTHILNAISPAFTSAFAFAELIVESGFNGARVD